MMRVRLNKPNVRIRPKQHCSNDSAEELYIAMNKSMDVVIVTRGAIGDTLECHRRVTEETSLQALPSLTLVSRNRYAVDRLELMKFMSKHGKVCPHG